MITVTLEARKISVGWVVRATSGHETAVLTAHDTRQEAEEDRDHLARCLRALGIEAVTE